MSQTLRDALDAVLDGSDLDEERAADVLRVLATEDCPPALAAGLLGARVGDEAVLSRPGGEIWMSSCVIFRAPPPASLKAMPLPTP